MHLGYWVDLHKVALSEGEVPSSWIMGMAAGKYQHPVYGEIQFNSERLQRFADGVKQRVRGIDLDIDYDHKTHTGKAAGWVKDAEVKDDALWLFVEWTKAAAQEIRNGEYRYFSPEFVDEWTNPATETVHQDVLNGGAITNRPFLKDLQPLNLSEFGLPEPARTEGTKMDRKTLCGILKLSEDATDADITAAITKLQETPPPPRDEQKELVQLAESNPVIKAMLERQALQDKAFAELQAAHKLTEVRGQVTQLHEVARGHKRGLPPAINDDLISVLVGSSKELGEKVIGILSKIAETGTVELGERGSTQNTKSGDPVKMFTDEVAGYMKDNTGVAFADAVGAVASAKPSLYEGYVEATYAGIEN